MILPYITTEQQNNINRYFHELTEYQKELFFSVTRSLSMDQSLTHQLQQLSKVELDDMRKTLRLRGASRLNKQALVKALEPWVLEQLPRTLSLLDVKSLELVKTLYRNKGLLEYDFSCDFRVVLSLSYRGILYFGYTPEHGYILLMPTEVVAACSGLFTDSLQQTVEQNDEALHIVRGLLEYYGVCETRMLRRLLHELLPGLPRLQYEHVIHESDDMPYYTLCYIDNDLCYIHPEVLKPGLIWGEHEVRRDVPYREVSREEALKAGRDRHSLWNEHHYSFLNYLRSKSLSEQEAWDTLEFAYYQLRNGERFVEAVKEVIADIPTLETLEEASRCTTYLQNIHNTSSTWMTRGWAPLDFRKRSQAQEEQNSVKVGRNEPCPCGSGKKYKKCCGAIIPFAQKTPNTRP